MATKQVKKKCEKCGAVCHVKPRERRCKQIVVKPFGDREWCWGHLKKVERKKRELSDLDKMQHAAKQLDEAITRVGRVVTSIKLWRRRYGYYMAKAEGRIRQYERKQKDVIDRHTRAIDLE